MRERQTHDWAKAIKYADTVHVTVKRVIAEHGLPRMLDVEDLESAAMERVASALGRYNGSVPKQQWVMFAARYGALDRIREETGRAGSPKTRHRTFHYETLVDEDGNLPSFMSVPPDVSEVDNTDSVEALLSAMDLRMELCVRLSYLAGMPLKRIGLLLDVTESRMSQIRSAALSQLRERAAVMCA